MPIDDRFDLRRSRPLPDYMARVARSQSTGILTAFAGETLRELLFVDGELRAARSNSEEEKLGSWLVLRGLISDNERALTLLSQGGGDAPPLGHLLVTRGCLEQARLEQELEELAVTIICRAAAAPRTFCEFVEGRAEGQPDTLPNLTTTQLILLAARAFTDVGAMRAALQPMSQIVWPSTTLDTLLSELALTPSEAYFLSRLDGTRRLSELVSVSPLAEDKALATLYALKTAGVLSVGTSPDLTPAPLPDVSTRKASSGEHLAVVDESLLTSTQLAEREHVQNLADESPRVDHYRALGLERSVRLEEIENAWNRAQREFSPERSLEIHLRDLKPQLTTILSRSAEAYEVLSAASSRSRYDKVLRSIEEQQEAQLEESKKRRTASQAARSNLVEANFKRADELVKDGEVYLAIQLLEQACELDPRPAELLKLARLLMRNPLWSQRALLSLRKAIDSNPAYVDAWLELAEFWRRRNDPERQRKALERALAAEPEHPRATQMYQQLRGRRELERLLRRARDQQR